MGELCLFEVLTYVLNACTLEREDVRSSGVFGPAALKTGFWIILDVFLLSSSFLSSMSETLAPKPLNSFTLITIHHGFWHQG